MHGVPPNAMEMLLSRLRSVVAAWGLNTAHEYPTEFDQYFLFGAVYDFGRTENRVIYLSRLDLLDSMLKISTTNEMKKK